MSLRPSVLVSLDFLLHQPLGSCRHDLGDRLANDLITKSPKHASDNLFNHFICDHGATGRQPLRFCRDKVAKGLV